MRFCVLLQSINAISHHHIQHTKGMGLLFFSCIHSATSPVITEQPFQSSDPLSSHHTTTVLEVYISKQHSSDVVDIPKRSHKIHSLSEEVNILNLKREEKWERSHILKLLPSFVRTSLYEISEKKGRTVPDEEEQWNFHLWTQSNVCSQGNGFVNILRLHFRKSRASVNKRNIIISVRTHQLSNAEIIA